MNNKRYLKNILIAALSGGMMLFVSCNKKEEPKSDACDIVLFSVEGKTWSKSGTDITYTYPPETVEGELTPTIVISEGATINPPTSQAQNFFVESGVTYTVTAENGVTTKIYTAKAMKPKYTGCEILSFYVNNVEWDITGDSLITYVYPPETVEGELTPVITVSQGATIDPPADQKQNFFTPSGVRYTVTSEDGATTKVYTVRARRKYSDCNILSFTVYETEWEIDQENGLITHTYTNGIDSTNVKPTITLSPGATINPPGSLVQDSLFTENGVTYTVTAEDGKTTKTYTVKGIATVIIANTVGNCTWTLSGVPPNRTLIIGGNGYIPHFAQDDSNRPPWFQYKDDITTVVIENGVTTIGDYTFQDHGNIISVTIGNSVSDVGWNAFERCYSLTSVTFGNSVKNIGGAAFHMCGLTTLTLPASVEIIDYFAFHACPLTLVINHNPTPQQDFGPHGDYPFGNALDLRNVTLRVPSSSVNAYKSANIWKEFGTIQAIIQN